MAIEKELGSTYGGLRQDASLMGTTPSSVMEYADAMFVGDRDAQDINHDAIDMGGEPYEGGTRWHCQRCYAQRLDGR